jgi:hypothetical protein
METNNLTEISTATALISRYLVGSSVGFSMTLAPWQVYNSMSPMEFIAVINMQPTIADLKHLLLDKVRTIFY